MRRLTLGSEYVARLQAFTQAHRQAAFSQSVSAKSDYWQDHGARARIDFSNGEVVLDGRSGFYLPPEAGTARAALGSLKHSVQRVYKKLVMAADRPLGLEYSSLLPADMAYDAVFGHAAYAGQQESPFRLQPGALKPVFKTSRELGRQWFLRDRYAASAPIYQAAYHFAVFTHFLPEKASTYLEIGAGSGNLAAFFHHYGKVKVVIVDLPEIVVFSAAFLKSAFPGARIRLPHEVNGPITPGEDDFTFLLPSQISFIPDASVDLAVNTYSMQEMTQEQVLEYIELAQRVCRDGSLWCNDNRVEKLPSASREPMRPFHYPYAPGNEVLVWEVSRLTRLISMDATVIRVKRIRKPSPAAATS